MEMKKFDIIVLFVEDDKAQRESLLPFLKTIFKKVLVVDNGLDAIEQYTQHKKLNEKVELLITDIDLPQMDGFELIRQLRKHDPSLHTIITSGVSFGPFISEINSISVVNDFIAKPFTVQKLYSIIEKATVRIKVRRDRIEQSHLAKEYQKALDHAAIVSKTDLDGYITYANEKFCKISGYTKDELVGSSHNIIRHPENPKALYEELWRTIQAKKVFKHPSISNMAKDGSTYYVNTTIAPILDINDEIIEYISVRFNTTALENSIIQERKAKESQTLFLANMSHEIRTPLNGILGFAEMLEKSQLSPKESEYIDIINSSASNLLNTLNGILDMSKIITGNMQVEEVFFNPLEEFEIVKKLFKERAQTKNIKLLFNMFNNFHKNFLIKGDILKLKQVLFNLLNNAIKFTPKNGNVSLNIVVKDVNDDRMRLLFAVEDDGIGIGKETQKDIFKPFIQESQSTTREYGGTGLGLAISKEIVAALGGMLQLRSQKKKGSKFYFELEFEYKDKKKVREKKKSFLKTNSFKGNILVAEDEEINRKLMNAILTRMNLNTTFVKNGREAVDIFKRKNRYFDLILLDINMPEMDGLDACTEIKKIKEEYLIDNIPIIAQTAYAIKGDKVKFIKHGFDGYLSKPIDLNELVFLFSKYLEKESHIKEEKRKINKETFIAKNAKKLDIPEEFYEELLNDFFNLIDKDINLLEQSLLNNDLLAVSNQAHKLKGLCGNLALYELHKIFFILEDKKLQEKDWSEYLENAKSEIKEIAEIIKNHYT